MPSIIGLSSLSLLTSPSKAAHVSESHPLMMIEPEEEDEDGRSLCCFYDYMNGKVVNTNTKIPEEVDRAICVGSSHGWLAYVSRLDCSVFLWSPFTTSPLILLPPIHTLPFVTIIPREELDDDVEEDDVAYDDNFSSDFGFKVETEEQHGRKSYYTMSPKLLSLRIIGKIVLSFAPTSDDCIVVALPRHNTRNSIAFCKPGDKSWTFVEPPLKKSLDLADVIHFKNQLFYTVSNYGGTTLCAYDLADLSSPKSYNLETSFNFESLSALDEGMRRSFSQRYYLVESLGDLLWVRRLLTNNMNDDGEFTYSYDSNTFPDQTIMFDVYRLDFSQNTWKCIKCIGDQVVFLGINQSLSLSAQHSTSLKANRIYFTDDSYWIHRKYHSYGGQDFGHYELEGSTIRGGLKCRDQKILPPPVWVMRNFH
ncbi:putative F-box protein At5g55150 [Corylus avellana]|uniref:putative F-box protein At5g55150 n=1 Tax=Corylus avellana TaxID=13451 RepID=UPI00286C6791|nr:putative F-box protein At5g55150 [Corylus avellana]